MSTPTMNTGHIVDFVVQLIPDSDAATNTLQLSVNNNRGRAVASFSTRSRQGRIW